MKIYNVSCMMMTTNDNGVCFSFLSESRAIECRDELLAEGAYHVRLWS